MASAPPSLVFPPLIIGCLFLLLSRCKRIRNQKRLYTLSLTLSAWGLILGFGLAAANIAVWLFAKINRNPAVATRKIQLSSRRHLYATGQSNKLGFNYMPSQTVLAQRWRETASKKEVLYSATYTIDERGNRKTCLESKTQPPPPGSTVLFIGDSFTMGEGLDDCDTLPSLFARASGLNAINAATNGHGTHQALKLLEDDQLLKSRIGKRKVHLIVYRMIKEHLHRATGNSPWDAFGPCYQVNQSTQNLEYKGPFSSCLGMGKVATLAIWTAANELQKSKEPLTYRLGTTLASMAFSGLKKPIGVESQRLFIAMMEDMKRHASRHGASLLVIFEDNDPDCLPDRLSDQLINALSQQHIPVIRGSRLISASDCLNSRFKIPGDGHPNRDYNLLVAERLAQEISKGSSIQADLRPAVPREKLQAND